MKHLSMIIGYDTRGVLTGLGSFFSLSAAMAARAVRLPRVNLLLLAKITVNQIRFTGFQAMGLISVVALLIGAVAIMQSLNLLPGLADEFIGSLLVSVVVRELGPLVTAVVLIGRSGTAITTELGSMRLNGEIDALIAHRIDPLMFILLPRVIGAICSLFCLVIFFDFVGIFGGFVVTVMMKDVSFSLLYGRLMAALGSADLTLSLIKTIAFGHTTAVLCCYNGLKVEKSPTELPQAVTRAVVTSLASVFLLDGALTAAFYLL